MADRTNYIENILRLSQVDFKYLNYDAIFSEQKIIVILLFLCQEKILQ